MSKMTDEFSRFIRSDHEGWKIAVRNARLIEDGLGSVIGKVISKPHSKDISSSLTMTKEKNNELRFPMRENRTEKDKLITKKLFYRNNPHPRIKFPFPSGDRLKTYKVWSADLGMEPPPFIRENIPPRPKLRQSTGALNEGYKTVYQLEISEIPAKMRYGVDAINYQSPELIKHSPFASKYSWATGGFVRDTFPSFRHHNVPPVSSRLNDAK
ncbi:uncharacterized protein LOC124445803 [Xenia sp. Carnegie-2017]|uniref:uncharacterized protein LOC124445803 n=1 Tax=Xenia sp. Carnegie-2017 TaxID=2897299 RepID=UPI001F049C2A|nr:uncharacterized protein LOC124445803 [Xenia sp. Carnegie-2017]